MRNRSEKLREELKLLEAAKKKLQKVGQNYSKISQALALIESEIHDATSELSLVLDREARKAS